MQRVNKHVKNHAMQYEYMYTIITCTLHIKLHIHVNAHYILFTGILLDYMYAGICYIQMYNYTITLQCMTSTFLKSALSAKNPTYDTTKPNSLMEVTHNQPPNK